MSWLYLAVAILAWARWYARRAARELEELHAVQRQLAEDAGEGAPPPA